MKKHKLTSLTQQELLHLIREKDNDACGFLFSSLNKYFRAYLKPWTWDPNSAKSLSCLVLAILIEMPVEPVLKVKLLSYAIQIGRNQWSMIQKRDKRLENREAWFFDEIQAVEDIFEQTVIEEKHRCVNDALLKVGDKCRKLLTLFCQGFSPEEVCTKFGYSSKRVYQVKKSECLNKLKLIVLSSPEYRELFDLGPEE